MKKYLRIRSGKENGELTGEQLLAQARPRVKREVK